LNKKERKISRKKQAQAVAGNYTSAGEFGESRQKQAKLPEDKQPGWWRKTRRALLMDTQRPSRLKKNKRETSKKKDAGADEKKTPGN